MGLPGMTCICTPPGKVSGTRSGEQGERTDRVPLSPALGAAPTGPRPRGQNPRVAPPARDASGCGTGRGDQAAERSCAVGRRRLLSGARSLSRGPRRPLTPWPRAGICDGKSRPCRRRLNRPAGGALGASPRGGGFWNLPGRAGCSLRRRVRPGAQQARLPPPRALRGCELCARSRPGPGAGPVRSEWPW